MPWITLTADDLTGRFAGPELTALRTAVLAAGDPTDEVMADAVERVRGYVASCERNTLGEPGTIPARLKSAALAVACWDLLLRLPVKSFATPAREKAYDDAVKLLEQVAVCKFTVDAPEVAESPSSSTPAPSPSWKGRRREFTRPQQDGA